MAAFIKRIRTWFASFLSVETLMREQKFMLFGILFYFCATGISGVYVNMYLYQTTVNIAGKAAMNALTNVIVFNLLTYIFSMLFSGLLGIFGKRIPDKNGLLAGLSIYAVLYVLLLSTDAQILRYIVWLALLNAAGSAFFHISYNQVLGAAFGERTKRLFITIVSSFVTIAGVLTPLVAGALIQSGRNMNGYYLAFGMAMVMLAISFAFVVCVRLPRRKLQKRTYFAGVLLQVLSDRDLRLLHFGELLRGVRDGALGFLLPVLIYSISSNAFAVGFYMAICSVLQILGERHVSVTVREENRMGLMLFAVAVMLLTTVVFAFGFNVMSVYAYGIITALVGAFLYVPIVGLSHWGSSRITNVAKKTMEIQLVREFMIHFGKVLGVLFVLIFYKLNILLAAVIVVNFILVLAWVLFSRIGEDTELLPIETQTTGDETDVN